VLHSVFLQLSFGFIIFWHKNIGTKGARKILMKLTPAVNFINIKRTSFSYERHFGSFFLRMYVRMYIKKLPKQNSYKKHAFNVDEIDTSWERDTFCKTNKLIALLPTIAAKSTKINSCTHRRRTQPFTKYKSFSDRQV